MTAKTPLLPLLAVLALAACVPPPPEPEPPLPLPGGDVTPGFNDKEPDTCKAGGLQGLVGQPEAMLQTVPITGPLRLIHPNEVFDQEEYRAARVDVFVDAAGIIQRISCG